MEERLAFNPVSIDFWRFDFQFQINFLLLQVEVEISGCSADSIICFSSSGLKKRKFKLEIFTSLNCKNLRGAERSGGAEIPKIYMERSGENLRIWNWFLIITLYLPIETVQKQEHTYVKIDCHQICVFLHPLCFFYVLIGNINIFLYEILIQNN